MVKTVNGEVVGKPVSDACYLDGLIPAARRYGVKCASHVDECAEFGNVAIAGLEETLIYLGIREWEPLSHQLFKICLDICCTDYGNDSGVYVVSADCLE